MVIRSATYTAKKAHRCNACYVIFNESSLSDYTEEEQVILKKALENKCKILPGMKYLYFVCTYPDFGIFRAIPEVYEIYVKYKLYEE